MFSEMTVEKLDVFIPQLLSKLYIEGLIYGNVTKQVCVSSNIFVSLFINRNLAEISTMTFSHQIWVVSL